MQMPYILKTAPSKNNLRHASFGYSSSMKLTDYTDYTLRALIYLGLNSDRLVTIQQIAESYGISRNHLMKIVNQLSQDGIVHAVRGRNGGLELAVDPAKINIGRVVRSAEQDFRLVECFEGATNQCVLSPACRLQHSLRRALEAFFRVLDDVSLADLIENANEIRQLVPGLAETRAPTRK